ncbi:hypothetical protein GCM10025867_04480 [Frondihabitans sucicola]|uniref:SGNH domain-containing protein n=1 Tax=Frondihabitans sucicola TaxID=1268041 RepID=A0ABN6XT68_9MICO|nr:hypothetical protein GCM10025867_04480 [Frondihabitans sucicola]
MIANTYRPVTAVGEASSVISDAWAEGLSALVSRFSGSVGEVILLAAPPSGTDVTECYTPRSTPTSCAFRLPGSWTTRLAAERSVAQKLDLALVDSRSLVCASGACPAFVGTTPVRTDRSHLTLEYARKIAPSLGELLAATGRFSVGVG